MTPPAPIDDKYVVFKQSDFYVMLGYLLSEASLAGEQFDMAVAPVKVDENRLMDAVVIRRQDLFASPALHSYANSIAVAVATSTDEITAKRLQKVADYFHEQAVAAGEEGYKLPGD